MLRPLVAVRTPGCLFRFYETCMVLCAVSDGLARASNTATGCSYRMCSSEALTGVQPFLVSEGISSPRTPAQWPHQLPNPTPRRDAEKKRGADCACNSCFRRSKLQLDAISTACSELAIVALAVHSSHWNTMLSSDS